MEINQETILKSWQTENPIIPTKQQLKENSMLLYYDNIVSASLDQDPSIIILLKNSLLKEVWCQKVLQQGLIITEELLKENPTLCKFKIIMEEAIKHNPELIKYTKCMLSQETIDNALKTYTPTKRDIENNHELVKLNYLMEKIPEFKYYAKYPLQIITLKETILKNPEEIKNHPLLKIKTEEQKENIIKLLKLLIEEETTTEKEQKEYQRYLEIVINKIIELRYKKQKTEFEFSDIVSLNDAIINVFNKITKQNQEEIINTFVTKIYTFVNETISKTEIKTNILKFYKKYIEQNSLKISETNIFCNKILNYHRNSFFKQEKIKLTTEIKQVLELTEKKQNQLYTRRKLKVITHLIKDNKLNNQELQELIIKIQNLRKDFKTNKKMLKENVILTEEMLKKLDEIFLKHGTLNNQNIENIVKTNNKKIIKYIINKYEKTKLSLLNNIKLENLIIEETDKINFSLNANNFIINNKEQTNYNIINMILQLNDETITKIIENEQYLKEIKGLLSFLNLMQELQTQTLVEIILNYQQIQNKKLNEYVNKKEYIYQNLDKIILLAQGYYMINDISIQALGPKIIRDLGEIHITDYLDFYLKMLKKTTSNIPPIELKYNGLHLKSGDYFNVERLLIGKLKNLKGSCIDLLNPAGKKTYEECLLKQQGDVILIKKEGKLLSRIFVFRRGNVIQLVSQTEDKYDLELYYEIAHQMKRKAIQENDNIEYIVVNENSVKNPNQNIINDFRLTHYFPHCDTIDSAVILYKKNNAKLNFIIEPNTQYKKVRKPIIYNPTDLEINRIKALYSSLTNYPITTNENYQTTIIGEDWLLALTQDNEIEEIILNPEDKTALLEIEQARQILNQQIKSRKK